MAACVNHPSVTDGLVRCSRCGRPFCPNCLVRLGGASYCGSCKGEQVRDIQSGTTPGQIELAPIGRRIGAIWVDSFLFGVLGFGAAFALSDTTGMATDFFDARFWVWTGTFALLWLLYEGVLLQLRGQTLGKMMFGIKVVTLEGADVGAGQAWGRALVRQVFISYLSILNYLPAAFTKQRTCVHDILCKTRVMRLRR
jgi:uncharacterized RDD family membrane protein YckC